MTAIGLDIGGTRLRAARIAADGAILARATAPSSADPAEVLVRCIRLVAEVTAADVTALGIGVPGQVQAGTRRVLSGGYVDLSGMDFAGLMETATGLPVTLENDATMALLGEAACGAARGCVDVVMLTIGTGIGGAILEQGRVLRGRGAAGQLGHIIVQPGGRLCVCGRTGCVETVSSGTAFGVHLAEAGLPPTTRAEDLLTRQDPTAIAVITAWAAPLRQAVDTLISVSNPQVVVIGGGAGAAAVQALATIPPAQSWFTAPIVGAYLGDDAGVVGAAMRVMAKPEPKRAILVNGVPASGKSSVARALADATGLPILALDIIKNPFLIELPPGDRAFNRTLGRASYAAIFDLIHDAPAGTTFIIDAWFGFMPPEMLTAGLARAGVDHAVEIWCEAPPETVGARYAARLGQRPAGHPGADYVPELIALATRAKPLNIGANFTVDTTAPLPLAQLLAWLQAQGIPTA
jgi:glucokinase